MTDYQGKGALMMCRPRDPADYSPERRLIWDQALASMAAKGEATPAIYPGSISMPCDRCQITVTVGPRQQEALEVYGKDNTPVLCMVCIPELIEEATAGGNEVEVTVGNLGNPFKKA